MANELTADFVEGYEGSGSDGWDDYPLDELSIREERRSAIDVVRRLAGGRFQIDPDFQRDFVWKKDKQSRLIESVLMRIPLPVFYVAENHQGLLIVVDGRQRLTTLQLFLDGKLALDLPNRPELNNKSFNELEPRLQNRVEDCQLHFYIIDRTVPERARLDIFERVNGGEVLSRQQMRNAIYNGIGTRFLKAVAESDWFTKATGDSLNVKKMQDREFVNRFCSFNLLPLSSYKGDMDEWLGRGLQYISKMSKSELDELGKKFRLGLSNNHLVFKQHAFRKHRYIQQSRSVINASLFDVMMYEMSKREKAQVEAKADKLRDAFFDRMEDQDFMKSITYSPNSANVVRARFRIASEMFREVFDD